MLVDGNNTAGLLFGRITAVDAVACRIRVQLPDRDGMQTYWIHVPQKNAHRNQHRSLPDLGAHVAILVAANGVDGVYLGSIYSDGAPPPVADDSREYVRFADGTEVSYDTAGGGLAINCVTKVTVMAVDTITVVAGDSVTVDTPELTITGNATIEKRLTVKGGMAIRGGEGGATAAIQGDISVDGSIDATGTIMDAGGNSNHHTH